MGINETTMSGLVLRQWRRNLPAIRTFPDARVVEFDAGHAPQLEMPEAFADEIERFLSAVS